MQVEGVLLTENLKKRTDTSAIQKWKIINKLSVKYSETSRY